MNTPDQRIDAWFSGHSTPESTAQLAANLTSDAIVADAFVAQAKMDALLEDIFTDQRAAHFHEAMLERLEPPIARAPIHAKPMRVRHLAFPSWRQAAAALLVAGLLWGMVSVWSGVSKINTASDHPGKPVRTSIAIANAEVAAPPSKKMDPRTDAELEAWLRNYFVDAQPAASHSLRDWLKLLVQTQFALHNHFREHVELAWEIREEDPAIMNALSEQSMPLEFRAGSLFDQVCALAALGGCELHVEPGTLVLSPMKEASQPLETKTLTLTNAFLQNPVAKPVVMLGESSVVLGLPATLDAGVIVTRKNLNLEYSKDGGQLNSLGLPQPVLVDYMVRSEVAQSANDPSLFQTSLPTIGIDWQQGASVGNVTALQVTATNNFAWASSLQNPQTLEDPSLAQTELTNSIDVSQASNVNLSYISVSPAGQAYEVTVTTSPKGLRQLAILEKLSVENSAPPSLQVTDFTFPIGHAPQGKDRVLEESEIADIAAAWSQTASQQQTVSSGGYPVIPQNSHLWSYQPALGNMLGRQAPAMTVQADLTTTRSGRLLVISGAINHRVQPANTELSFMLNAQPETHWNDVQTQIVDLQAEDDGRDIYVRDGQNFNDPQTVTPLTREPSTPPAGVDLSLSLVPGQGAIVAGPTVDGQVHWYLLRSTK